MNELLRRRSKDPCAEHVLIATHYSSPFPPKHKRMTLTVSAICKPDSVIRFAQYDVIAVSCHCCPGDAEPDNRNAQPSCYYKRLIHNKACLEGQENTSKKIKRERNVCASPVKCEWNWQHFDVKRGRADRRPVLLTGVLHSPPSVTAREHQATLHTVLALLTPSITTSTLKMEAVCSSENLASTYNLKRHYNPEGKHLHAPTVSIW
jgi:hypothetical protein